MSKYIPGNQKHLTLNDRIYIENELSKGATFKDIAAFLCKDPTTISKRLDHDVFLTGTTKELSIMPKTFVYTAITVKNKRLWKNHSLRCQMHILSNLQPDL